MFNAYLLVFLILIPVFAYWYVRRRSSGYVFSVTGAAFGVVVSPFALGLYSLYHLSPWGVVPGFVGMALMFVHGVPGFQLAVSQGLIPSEVVSNLRSHLIIESINAFVWAFAYGLIGFAVDKLRLRPTEQR